MTKEQISTAVQAAVDAEVSCLEVYALIKDFEKDIEAFISSAKEQVQILALEEAESYGEKTFVAHGYKFERRAGRSIYSYNHIPQWTKINDRLKQIESLSKAASQPAFFGKAVVDEETGEVILPAEITYSADVLVVKKIS